MRYEVTNNFINSNKKSLKSLEDCMDDEHFIEILYRKALSALNFDLLRD